MMKARERMNEILNLATVKNKPQDAGPYWSLRLESECCINKVVVCLNFDLMSTKTKHNTTKNPNNIKPQSLSNSLTR